MTFSIRQLRYFVAVAEAGQVSAAAKELFISQSAVTSAIQDIEKRLGRPVFTRTARGVRLTDTGMALLPKAREILRMMSEAAEVTETDAALRGVVRAGVTYTVMGYFLPQHIQRLAARHPNLEITWLEMDRASAEQMLIAGELDFALLLTSNLRSSELKHETFVHSVRRLWMAPNHPLARLPEVHLADVAEHPYALLAVDEADQTTRAYWGELEPRVFVETTSIEAVRSIVANGNGVTILSDMVYRPWSLEGKRIETAIVTEPVPDMRIGLAWRKAASFTPAMTALYDYFHGQFNTPGLQA